MSTAYYYQVTCYDIPDLCLGAPENPNGPYDTAEDRDDVLKADMGERDLECGVTAAVSLFKVENNQLVMEKSFIADMEDYPRCWDEDRDSDEEDEELEADIENGLAPGIDEDEG